MQKRINKLNIPINNNRGVSKDGFLTIVIDSTCMKVTNRVQCLQDK